MIYMLIAICSVVFVFSSTMLLLPKLKPIFKKIFNKKPKKKKPEPEKLKVSKAVEKIRPIVKPPELTHSETKLLNAPKNENSLSFKFSANKKPDEQTPTYNNISNSTNSPPVPSNNFYNNATPSPTTQISATTPQVYGSGGTSYNGGGSYNGGIQNISSHQNVGGMQRTPIRNFSDYKKDFNDIRNFLDSQEAPNKYNFQKDFDKFKMNQEMPFRNARFDPMEANNIRRNQNSMWNREGDFERFKQNGADKSFFRNKDDLDAFAQSELGKPKYNSYEPKIQLSKDDIERLSNLKKQEDYLNFEDEGIDLNKLPTNLKRLILNGILAKRNYDGF